MNAPTISDLPLSSDEQRLVELINEQPPSHARHCFRSALEHLRRASLIQNLDPAMAVFRGITAEEEAATGLIHVLKLRRYPNAELLKPRDHVQKHAVTPFLRFLLHHLSEIRLNGVKAVRLGFEDIGDRKGLTVVLLLESDGEPLVLSPTPPLNFSVREGRDQDSGFPDLSRNIRELLQPTGYTNALNFLKAEANLRNRILYAGPGGYPVISNLKPEYLQDRQKRVMAIVKAALLILPYDEIQPFASDALNSFLRLVAQLSDEPQLGEV